MDIKQGLLKLKNKLLTKTNNDRYNGIKSGLIEEEKTLLEDVHTFRHGDSFSTADAIEKYFTSIRNVDLDSKVDDYIEWYFENMVKGHYTAVGKYWKPIELRNFIEKMAVWYELRYPEYEIDRIFDSEGKNRITITASKEIFINNPYIKNHNNNLNRVNKSEIENLEWTDFYNIDAFINSLSCEEKCFLIENKYNSLVYIKSGIDAHLHLDSKGYVEIAEGFAVYSNYKINDKQLEGMHIKDVIKLLKENNITLPSNNGLEKEVNNADKHIKQKEELLNCVMYRIIERGGNRTGPRRGFLFAKEFERNIDIPMMYAVDLSDPDLRLFVNEYIKAGGSKDLMCYVGYFSREKKLEKLDIVTIQKLILTRSNNCATFYTKEETELHQRMVNAISNQIDYDEVRKEEVKQLRLQRKLDIEEQQKLIEQKPVKKLTKNEPKKVIEKKA